MRPKPPPPHWPGINQQQNTARVSVLQNAVAADNIPGVRAAALAAEDGAKTEGVDLHCEPLLEIHPRCATPLGAGRLSLADGGRLSLASLATAGAGPCVSLGGGAEDQYV